MNDNYNLCQFYFSEDIIGVELGGALKNIIAIAAKDRKTRGVALKQNPDNLNKHGLLINLKFEIFSTPSTNPTEQIETMLPVRVPKIIT